MYRFMKARIWLLTGLIVLVFYFLISSSLQASMLAAPAGGPLAQSTVPTLAPLINLSIANNSGATQLSWTDSLGASSYEVHRSTSPFFAPTNGTLLTTLAGATQNYQDTPGGIGNVGTNYFYIVTASVQSTTQYSNWVGEMDYAVSTNNGNYSLIGIPFASPSPSDAAGLAAQIGNVSTVLGWNKNSQSFKTFTPNTGNFTFTQGDAIFAQVTNGASASVNILGKLDKSALSLANSGYNFITMPLYCDEVNDASSTAGDITNVANLLGWNSSTQLLRVFTPPSTGNFSLQVGTPFMVELGASGPNSWPVTTDICQ